MDCWTCFYQGLGIGVLGAFLLSALTALVLGIAIHDVNSEEGAAE